MNALVPQGKPRQIRKKDPQSGPQPEPTDRRRLLGFVLLLLAAFILLPELRLNQQDNTTQQKGPSLSPWVETTVDPRLKAQLAQREIGKPTGSVKPIEVPQVQLEQVDTSWSSQYHELREQGRLPANSPSVENSVALQSSAVVSALPPANPPVNSPSSPVQAAFMVQVGTFKKDHNATQLVEELDALGYQAFSRADQGFVKVMIGPQLRRQDAEKALVQIADDLALQGLIKTYRP